MSAGYKAFLFVLCLILALGILVFVYGLTNPSSLPRLTLRNIHAYRYLPHG